jgi:hypothetical protein
MILRDDREVELASDESKYESISAFKDASNVEYDVNGKSFVIRRSLNIQVCEEDVEQQMENIFHTRYHIKNKICSMIIDNGSCINVTSTTLVRKLNLTTTKHVTSYKLPWLNECGEVGVTK